MANESPETDTASQKNFLKILAYSFSLCLLATLAFFSIIGRLNQIFGNAFIYVVMMVVFTTIILMLGIYSLRGVIWFGAIIVSAAFILTSFAGEAGLAIIAGGIVAVAFVAIFGFSGYLLSQGYYSRENSARKVFRIAILLVPIIAMICLIILGAILF
jgi:hypothetical protein